MDYRKLCVELFGTDDGATLRKIAAEYRKKNTRNAGRKRKIADEDIHKMRAMRNAGTSMQELARTFGLSRQTVERYLNTAAGDGCTMRITYMFRRQPCTVIDVDFLDQKVVIQNKTDDILHRAFVCWSTQPGMTLKISYGIAAFLRHAATAKNCFKKWI